MLSALVVSLLFAGCEKDTDCKGDRVCEAGPCVSPAAVQSPPGVIQRKQTAPNTPPPPPPAPLVESAPPLPPPDEAPVENAAPGVIRRKQSAPNTPQTFAAPPPPPPQAEVIDPCRVPTFDDGTFKPKCRPKSKVAATERPEPLARAVGMLGIMGSALIAGGNAAPAFAFTGAVGVRFRPGIGVVAVLHGLVTGAQGVSIQMYGIGPGIRFGNRTQVTLGISPTIVAVTLNGSNALGVATSAFVQLGVTLGDVFTLVVMPVLTFIPEAFTASIAGGIGITF